MIETIKLDRNGDYWHLMIIKDGQELHIDFEIYWAAIDYITTL